MSSVFGGKSLTGAAGGGGAGVSGLSTANGGTALADNTIVRGDGTTGIQGSAATMSDAGVITAAGGNQTHGSMTPVYNHSTTSANGFGYESTNPAFINGTTAYAEMRNNAFAVRSSVTNAQGGIGTELPSATVPNIRPDVISDGNTGLGTAAADQLSGIAGGVECWRASEGVAGQSDGMTYRLAIDTNTSDPITVAATMADIGKWFCNTGAGAGIAANLPAAAVGLHYGFAVTTAQNIVITANGTDTIRVAGSVSTAGGTATNGTVGSTIYLICFAAGEWTAASAPNGTWTLSA